MQKNKKNGSARRPLLIAIAVVSVFLVALLVFAFTLSGKQAADSGSNVNQTNPTSPSNPSESNVPQTDVNTDPSGGVSEPDVYAPTEADPLVLDQGLYVVRMGNFSGRYVEDGSDIQLENFCAVIVENRSEKTLQLLQFTVADAQNTYHFQLTTLPPGERAIIQELNRTAFVSGAGELTANVELCLFFNEEPILYEDVLAVSGSDSGLEVRNLTQKEISGPIYIYYKTRTADGYLGGITYRLTIPGLQGNGTYSSAANHFWPGSSQVMFIDYVDQAN